MKKYLLGYSCFKVEYDPRNGQIVDDHQSLYFFVETYLSVTRTELVFIPRKYTRSLQWPKTICIADIKHIEWDYYSKSTDDMAGDVRYLVPGTMKDWSEVGYSRLTGGKKAEMECVITYDDGTESYFYFRQTPKNMSNISKIRDYVMKMKSPLLKVREGASSNEDGPIVQNWQIQEQIELNHAEFSSSATEQSASESKGTGVGAEIATGAAEVVVGVAAEVVVGIVGGVLEGL
jgi:hypothetical protein